MSAFQDLFSSCATAAVYRNVRQRLALRAESALLARLRFEDTTQQAQGHLLSILRARINQKIVFAQTWANPGRFLRPSTVSSSPLDHLLRPIRKAEQQNLRGPHLFPAKVCRALMSSRLIRRH